MKRMLWVLLAMSIGATYPSPIFPLYQDHFNLSSLGITLLFASYAICLLPSLLIVGSKGKSWGYRKVLIISVLISLVATILFMTAGQAWMLYVGRMFEGIAYGTFTGCAAAYLFIQTPPEKRGIALTLSGITISVGFGLGPAISGLMIQYADYQPLHFPFALLSLLLISSLIALYSLAEDSSVKQGIAPSKISLGIPKEISAHFRSFIGLSIFMVFTLNGIVLSLIPSFTKNVIHSSNLSISGLLILLLLGGGAMSQLIRWPLKSVVRIRWGLIMLLIGSCFTIVAGETSQLAFLWIGILIQAVGSGWTFQVSLRLAGSLPKPEERPQVISTYYLAAYSGFIVPIVGVGTLSYFFSLDSALIILNALGAMVIFYILLYSIRFQKYYAKKESVLLRTSR
ncbi:MFS transporter [Paenibacillus wynnii]|uniref:MFS transporter n=1 Tax=Paenibacillus wynnii TaxID=268407 RepID=UPI0027925C30|nr:MFS transporter [Paenibacillus wynnii]MDQ0194334.1 MFS family permease [Paenibacillus wynnii]